MVNGHDYASHGDIDYAFWMVCSESDNISHNAYNAAHNGTESCTAVFHGFYESDLSSAITLHCFYNSIAERHISLHSGHRRTSDRVIQSHTVNDGSFRLFFNLYLS